MKLFYKMGAFLVDRLKLAQPEKGSQELRQELAVLRIESKETIRDYMIRKVSMFLMIAVAGLILSVCCFFVYPKENQNVENQTLARPGYGEGDRKETLIVQVDGKEVQELEITVQDRKYTDREKKELTDQAIKELETVLPGDNQSLDEVMQDLVFPQSLADGAVQASWVTVPYGVIDGEGHLLESEDEDGVLVEIQGTLTCGGMETQHCVYAKVFPRELSENERLRRSIKKEVERADARESYGDTMKLPGNAGDRTLVWMYPNKNPFALVLIFALAAAAAMSLQMDNQIHKKAEERKNQLMLDYPDLLWKMTMLLGAGLSLKGTFQKLAVQYQKEQDNLTDGGAGKNEKRILVPKREFRYVYEEIAYTCYEMQSGISEAEAYERFGRRCQLPEYIRLGSVLSQNLKKGARGLTSLLETEAVASMTERKNNAKKLSERAGTKMLLPMVLMLGVVLAILMVPAFLSL